MISKSKLFLWLMLLFLAGIALRSFVSLNNFYLLAAFGIAAIFCFGWLNRRATLVSLSLIFAFSFGIFWFGFFELKELALSPLIGQEARLDGQVFGEPAFVEDLQRLIFIPGKSPKEKISVAVKRYPEFEHGDKITVSGKLEKPENTGSFNYQNYLLKDGIYFTVSYPKIELLGKDKNNILHWLIALKKRFEQNIGQALPMPHSAFANGILLGDKSGFSGDLKQAFIAAGVSHLVALSGYNISIIAIFISFIFGYLFLSRKKLAFWATLLLVALFVLMVGASASVVRAAVMGMAVLVARYFGRGHQAGRLLILAAFIMVLINPKVLVFDISFQLSFLAMLGLIYVSPWLEQKLKRIPEFWKFKESFIATVAAQIAVLPLLLYSFHQFSIVAPLTNTLIMPFVPYAMFFGFVVGSLGFIDNLSAQIAGAPLWLISSYQLGVIQYFANFGFSSVQF